MIPQGNSPFRYRQKEDLAHIGDELSHLWYQLHFMSVRHPNPEKFFNAWMEKLPPTDQCSCREELASSIEIQPPPLNDPQAFFWWSIALHDRVNLLLGKKMWHPKSRLSPLVAPLLIDTTDKAE